MEPSKSSSKIEEPGAPSFAFFAKGGYLRRLRRDGSVQSCVPFRVDAECPIFHVLCERRTSVILRLKSLDVTATTMHPDLARNARPFTLDQ